MFRLLRRTFGVCLLGIGLGILLVLLLPIAGWLFIIGAALLIIGLVWLFCWNFKIDYRKEERIEMTIVVKKVPKFLRGFVKLIFGIKDNKNT